MRKTKFYVLASAIMTIGFNSCENGEILEDNAPESIVLQTTASHNVLVNPFEENERMFNYFLDKYKAGEDVKTELYDYVVNMEENLQGLDNDSKKNFLLSAIDPERYACDTSENKMSAYLSYSIKDFTILDVILYIFNGRFPEWNAFYFEVEGKHNEFGYNGEYTNVINSTFKDLKRFWDIDGESIDMVPMKGSVYKDKQRIFEIHQAVFGVLEIYSRNRAELLYNWFVTPQWWYSDHPLLSANAVAIKGTNPFTGEPIRRIVMGDGILNTMDAIGFGDAAPQAILAHEYAHHIQYSNGYLPTEVADEDYPNRTRRAELMADAFAAYYLTHKRGATMNWWRLEQLLHVQSEIGDCAFSNAGHHGTPNQRIAAAKWGYEVAKSAQENGHILSSQDLYELFENDLDGIINCEDCLTTEEVVK